MLRLLLLVPLIFSLATATQAEDTSMRIGWEDWLPYQYRDAETDELTGLDVELLSAIADRAGYRLFWHKLAWEKHLWEVAAGSIDLAPGASRTPEREEYAYFSEPYRTEPVSLITAFDPGLAINRDNLLSLLDQGYHIGYVSGYSYAPWVNELIDQEVDGLEPAKSEEYLASALVDGVYDGFFADAFAAVASIDEVRDERGVDQPIYTSAVRESDIHIMFSQYSVEPAEVEHFNETIRAMKADGSLQDIIDRYLQ